MSLLLNDELIWVSIPRNASNSIERALYKSDIKIEHCNNRYIDLNPEHKDFKHLHYHLNFLNRHWTNKKTICIKRDWLERWISGLEHFWRVMDISNLTPIIPFDEIDNDFVYKVIPHLQKAFLTSNGMLNGMQFFLKEDVKKIPINESYLALNLLYPQQWWLGNKKCDYEFDVKEIWKFEKFILDSYNTKIELGNFNKSIGLKNKVVYDDSLKNALWEILVKPYTKGNDKII